MAPKASLLKGKAKAKAKGKPLVKGKSLPKDKTPTKSMKAKKEEKKSLKKADLDKLGKELSLHEKIEMAAAEAETPDEAAALLRKTMTKEEKSKLWSRYQTQLKKKTAEEQEAFKNKDKDSKGQEAALYLVRKEVPRFLHIEETVNNEEKLNKKEKWQSQKALVDLFGEQEFWAHVNSGRFEWREDPWTPDVYNYRDKGDITRKVSVKRARNWSQGQEYEPEDEEAQQFQGLMDEDLQSGLQRVQKGKGKGQLSLKGKGKDGKGKDGKGKKGKGLLALTNGEEEEEEEEPQPKTEEEEWAELLQKAKRARDQVNAARENCEAAMEKCDLAKRLSKIAQKDAETVLADLAHRLKQLKDILAKGKKAMSLENAKALLVDVMARVKECKQETKELYHAANKAKSVASTKK